MEIIRNYIFIGCFARVISEDEGRRTAESWKVPFLEASAKENSVSEVWMFRKMRV